MHPLRWFDSSLRVASCLEGLKGDFSSSALSQGESGKYLPLSKGVTCRRGQAYWWESVVWDQGHLWGSTDGLCAEMVRFVVETLETQELSWPLCWAARWLCVACKDLNPTCPALLEDAVFYPFLPVRCSAALGTWSGQVEPCGKRWVVGGCGLLLPAAAARWAAPLLSSACSS